MGHSYSLTTIKALFAQATHCAYPGCEEPLVFEDVTRAVRSIAVQIAHIRSEKPGGPRYDPSYPIELLHSEENLLLLCGKHHTPVDQNESVYSTDELLDWKSAQVDQGGGTIVSDAELSDLIRTLESTLSAIYAAGLVSVEVTAAGGRVADGGIVTMSLGDLSKIAMPDGSESTVLIGVKVANTGAASVDVSGAGVEIDVGAPGNAYATWIFGGPWCAHSFPHRLRGRSTDYWYVDGETAKATVHRLAVESRRLPRRFRVFADLGDDTRVEGEWSSALLLPVWKPGTTEEDLRGSADAGDDLTG